MGIVRKTLLRAYGIDPEEMDDTVEDLDARIQERARAREEAEKRRERVLNEARREALKRQYDFERGKG